MATPPPTRVERWIGARIDLRLLGKYVGTGHYFRRNGYMTDSGSDSEDDSEDE